MAWSQFVLQSSKSRFKQAQSFSEKMLPYWIAAALTALFSVFFAKVFSWSEKIFSPVFEIQKNWAFLIVPLGLAISAGLAEFISPAAAGSGIPQLIASIETENKKILKSLLSFKMIITKMIGTCVCVACGGVTGREGPNLQISAGLFFQIHKYWPQAKKTINLQSMILAGGAAGLASAFNTPLGGVVFAMEELAKVHISHVRTTLFHAVVIAGLLVHAMLGNYLYLGKPHFEISGFFEVFWLALGAISIGGLGAFFGVAILTTIRWRSRLAFRQRWGFTLAAGFILSFIFYFYGAASLGSGKEVILDLLSHPNEAVPWSLGMTRWLGSFLTYSSGVIGGIFAPALATGASFGAWMGHLTDSHNLPLWILVGMVAFLTGVTRSPFTSMILVFEMTDAHDVVVVLMLAAILAYGAAQWIDPVSFYEHAAHRWLHTEPFQGALRD